MPWSGSGTYSLPAAYSPEVNGTTIDATRYNGLTGDVATGITACLAKNGENVPTANLPMGGFKHTGAADGSASGQYLVYAQTTGASLGGTLAVTSSVTGASFIPSSSTVPSNGMYLSAANTLAFASNTTLRWSVNSTGAHTIAAPTSGDTLTISGVAGARFLNLSAALAGSQAILKLENSSNTASSEAVQLISVGGASAADPWLRFNVASVTDWSLGIDNSDSDSFKLSASTSLGSGDKIVVTTSGNVSIAAPASGTSPTLAIAGFSGTNDVLRVGDGATAPFISLYRGGSRRAYLQSDPASLYLVQEENLPFAVYTNDIQRLSIAAGGAVSVIAPSSGTALTVNGAALTPTSSQAFSATPTFNAALSNVFEFSGAMTANVTSVTISNPTAGQTISIRVKQDATGGRTFASPSGAKIVGSVGATASAASILTLTYSSADARWEGSWINLPA